MFLIILSAGDLVALIGGAAVLGAIGYWLFNLTSRADLPSASEPTDADRERSLRAPDFEGIREYFGTAVHPDVHWFYSQFDLVVRHGLTVRTDEGNTHTIDHFLPLSRETLSTTWYPIGDRRLPIAIDVFGNYLVVPVDAAEAEAPVLYIDHDGGGIRQISSSIRRLLHDA